MLQIQHASWLVAHGCCWSMTLPQLSADMSRQVDGCQSRCLDGASWLQKTMSGWTWLPEPIGLDLDLAAGVNTSRCVNLAARADTSGWLDLATGANAFGWLYLVAGADTSGWLDLAPGANSDLAPEADTSGQLDLDPGADTSDLAPEADTSGWLDLAPRADTSVQLELDPELMSGWLTSPRSRYV